MLRCMNRAQCIVCDPKSSTMLPAYGNTATEGLEAVSDLPVSPKKQLPPLSLTIKGEGKNMALRVDPEAIDLGVLSIGFLVRKEVCMMNQSDGILQYDVQCMEDGTSHPVERVSKKQQGQIRIAPSSDSQDFEIFADEPKGSIPAR